jgi:hypothetical protein
MYMQKKKKKHNFLLMLVQVNNGKDTVLYCTD